MHEKERHLLEYIVLFTGFAVLLALFYIFRYNRNALLMISGGGSVFYSIWGIIHHGLEGRLNKTIALEYMLISVLVFILLYIALSY
jgi:hypothetical protein